MEISLPENKSEAEGRQLNTLQGVKTLTLSSLIEHLPEKGIPTNQDVALDIKGQLDKGSEKIVTCSICYIDSTIETSFSSGNCNHSFCSDCYKQYLLNKMDQFQVLNIPCPQESCSTILTPEAIEKILNHDKFHRYQELVFKKITYKNLNQKFCPNIQCLKSLYIDRSQAFTTCSCGTKVCNTCSEQWHPEKPCIDTKDVDFELYAKDNEIKFCQICKTAIARVEGCIHITCCVCDYEWCWLCGNQYTQNHICTREWSPGVPSRETERREIVRRRGRKYDFTTIMGYIIELPVMIPMAILGGIVFALFWIAQYYTAMERRKGKAIIWWKMSLVTLFSVAFGPVLLIILSPYLLPKYIQERRAIRRLERPPEGVVAPKKRSSRWLTGNRTSFKYTEQAKPEQHEAVIQIQDNNGAN